MIAKHGQLIKLTKHMFVSGDFLASTGSSIAH